MLLGCIADDLTGATDLALTLTREGLRTLQTTGVPSEALDLEKIDCVVVALKSRTIPAPEAIGLSLQAADWLLEQGAKRIFFKYCSTFDSRDNGNIGQVLEALLNRLNENITIACPAFPANGRSIYMGQLFVNDVPLAESPMKDHPLTPMRDSDLRRGLRKQTKGEIGHIAFEAVEKGASSIRAAINREKTTGKVAVIVDALSDTHLRSIGEAVIDLRLITGGSGIAIGLPAAYLAAGLIDALAPPMTSIAAPKGRSIILSGSCSMATRGQVQHAIAAGMPSFKLDPIAIASGTLKAHAILNWLKQQSEGSTPLIYSSDDPQNVATVQQKLGREHSGQIVENLMAEIARSLPRHGFTRFLVAGGETSGAVVEALGVKVLSIGPEISPGVPWTLCKLGPELALALKSGNFGSPDFFTRAWEILQ